MSKLAINGGPPVRTKPLPPSYPGALLMGKEEVEAVTKVIEAQSPFRFYGEDLQGTVNQLEDMMKEDLNVKYALGVTSCTAGLVVALKALGIGYGDKVIVPSISFIASATAVISAQAVPVFVDVDETLNMDPEDLEEAIDEDVKAMIVVPLNGNPNDMDKIMAIARKHDVKVIEDVAQSCGVEYKGHAQGTIGDIGVFSFQMNKILTSGEGGAVVTNDVKLFERAMRYHDQGSYRRQMKPRYPEIQSVEAESAFAGQNYRMSEITGAVLVEQWKKLDLIISNLKKNYPYIKEQVKSKAPALNHVETVDEKGNLGRIITFRFPDKELAAEFKDALNAENINARLMYNGKVIYQFDQIKHQRTAEKDNMPFNYPFKNPVIYKDGLCPKAEDYIYRTVIVDLHPLLEDPDVEDIIEGITKVYQGLGLEEKLKANQA